MKHLSIKQIRDTVEALGLRHWIDFNPFTHPTDPGVWLVEVSKDGVVGRGRDERLEFAAMEALVAYAEAATPKLPEPPVGDEADEDDGWPEDDGEWAGRAVPTSPYDEIRPGTEADVIAHRKGEG